MIAEILFEVAWKSTVVAAAVVVLLSLMRTKAPSDRVAVGGLGLVLLLALPLVVLALSVLPVSGIEVSAPAAAIPGMPQALHPEIMMLPLPSAAEAASASPLPLDSLLLAAWAAGSLLVLLRLGAGLATLRRWTQRAQPVQVNYWRVFVRRCGVPEGTALLVSDEISAPLSWGSRKPVILIGRDTMADVAEAEAVIAHEAAHLSRGDWPRLIAARAVVALFWFNPFVWLLERLYLQDVEEAADAVATQRIEPARYAQALLNVARNAAVPAGANSIASGALSKRIRRVLSGRQRSRWQRAWRTGALASVAVVAGPIAVVQFVAPAMSAAVAATPRPFPVEAPVAAAVPAAVNALVTAPADASQPAPAAAPAAVASAPALPASAPLAVIRSVATIPAALAVFVQPATAAAPSQPVVDDEAIREAMEASREAAEAAREASRVGREQARLAREQARQAQDEAREAMIVARSIDHEKIRREVEVAMAEARREMMRGADEMERGAVGMREGAKEMREEARKLRDPAYRRKVQEEHRARGQKVPTDRELLDAIPKMEKGADRMEASIDDMRRGAAKMREEARKR